MLWFGWYRFFLWSPVSLLFHVFGDCFKCVKYNCYQHLLKVPQLFSSLARSKNLSTFRFLLFWHLYYLLALSRNQVSASLLSSRRLFLAFLPIFVVLWSGWSQTPRSLVFTVSLAGSLGVLLGFHPWLVSWLYSCSIVFWLSGKVQVIAQLFTFLWIPSGMMSPPIWQFLWFLLTIIMFCLLSGIRWYVFVSKFLEKYYNYYLFLGFLSCVSWQSFTGGRVTASILGSHAFYSIFCPISKMLMLGWSRFILWLLTLPVPFTSPWRVFHVIRSPLVSPFPSCLITFLVL